MVVVQDPLAIPEATDVFEHLLPYILRIEEKAGGQTPEVLLESVKSGSVTVHPVGEDAFLIASWSEDEMFVVCAASFNLACVDFSHYISATINYAKQRNCCKIGFISTRKAWKRIARTLGFTEQASNYYVKEVLYGC